MKNEAKNCKFYKKVFMGTQCSLFKSPCYGEHCNFHKEFIKLAQYEQQILQLKAENEQLTQKLENLTKENKELSEDFQATFKEMGERGKKLEKTREDLNTIFTTLEKANNSGLINDTIWVTDLMTLWDLIQQALKELEE